MADYVELHAHSYFSLLDGASSPEMLLERARELGLPALALTDHDNLSGAVRFWRAARERDIHPVIGAEVTLADGRHLTLLAENQTGYANLSRLLTLAHLGDEEVRRTSVQGTNGGAEQPPSSEQTLSASHLDWPGKTPPRLSWEALNRHRQGLIALSGCRQGPLSASLLAGGRDQARAQAERLRAIFGRRQLFIELQRHLLPDESTLIRGLIDLARRLDLPLVATNNVHYAERDGHRLQDVLVSIRHLTSLDEAGKLLRPNSEFHLKAPAEMARIFASRSDAIANTLAIAERCRVSLDFGHRRLPDFPVPEGHTPFSFLYELCQQGLHRKIRTLTPAASKQLAYELDVIERAGLSGFFLIVWDIVRFARAQGIRYQGRGSAANSLVAYLLDITPVDPQRFNLLFDRFLSPDRHTMPDIDIDFASDRREEVIQYIYRRYGRERTAMVCNVNTFRTRSAIRDVARALGLQPELIPHLQAAYRQSQEGGGEEDERTEEEGPYALLLDLAQQLQGVPRHLSLHNGGMVITAEPLCEIVPLERATMPGRVVMQWDKDSVEDAGLIKFDILGLRTLGMVDEIAALVATRNGHPPPLDDLSLDDPAVYDALCNVDTIGVFQVESRAQAQMLPRLRPRCFEDLVIEVAIIRPGPIQGDMVHPYLRRRQGLEPVAYPHPLLEPVLAETLGVVLFQEQVLRVAMVLAGFSGGEADQLRRVMTRKDPSAAMKVLARRFVQGAMANGLSKEEGIAVFGQLAGFASYGFCKSHAAAFALLAYQTAWLKVHHPAEFTCALLNHQPMGFYSPAVVLGDARRHGIEALSPDVNRSEDHCTLEGESIRLGLRYVKHVGPDARARIMQARGERPFAGLRDFCQRTRLPRAVVEALIRAGATDCLDPDRRQLLWALRSLDYRPRTLDLDTEPEPVSLPDLTESERMAWHLDLLGLSPGDHPLRLYRPHLRAAGILSAAELARRHDGEVVKVAGLVVVHQRPPTAKGHSFITLEDETGLVNLIIRPRLYEKRRDVLLQASVLAAVGRLQREQGACSVVGFEVWEVEDFVDF